MPDANTGGAIPRRVIYEAWAAGTRVKRARYLKANGLTTEPAHWKKLDEAYDSDDEAAMRAAAKVILEAAPRRKAVRRG